jgi:hypothetical protein
MSPLLPDFVFLPVDGQPYLCTVSATGVVESRAPAPGNADAVYKISTDQKFFAFLDSANKRFAVYELLDAEPWLQRIVAPTNLPRDCVAYDFILHDGQLLVGGRSRSQENIWLLNYTLAVQPAQAWQALEVPEAVRKSGKSIDLLYVLGQTLVAVDNVIRPKWFVFYHLNKGALPTPVGLHPIRVRSAFEGIRHGAESDALYALFSAGAGQRGASSYVQLYFKDDIAKSVAAADLTTMAPSGNASGGTADLGTAKASSKVAAGATAIRVTVRSMLRRDRNRTLNWQFFTPMGNDADDEFGDWEEDDDFEEELPPFGSRVSRRKEILPDPKLLKLKAARAKRKELLRQLPGTSVFAMIFCQDYLLLAMGEQGVWVANTAPVLRDRRVDLSARFRQVASVQLTQAVGFEKKADQEGGVFVLGRNSAETVSYEWLGLEQIVLSAKARTRSAAPVLTTG